MRRNPIIKFQGAPDKRKNLYQTKCTKDMDIEVVAKAKAKDENFGLVLCGDTIAYASHNQP